MNAFFRARLLLGVLLLSLSAVAEEPPAPGAAPPSGMPAVTEVPDAGRPLPGFSAEAATEAYLTRIPAAAAARSDAYFEGGYWLLLWDFLYGAAVLFLLLNLRWSAKLRDLAGKVTRLKDPRITQPILSMARANGIPARDVFQIDASRQTTRMSANVSGLGSTMRITLNDNLLRRGSPAEIQSVMGHEMGHYVLNHVYKGIGFFAALILGSFALLRWALAWSLARWGNRWQIHGLGDTAVIPLALLLISTIFFVLTPVTNTVIRNVECEADLYGLNAAAQPDGFAQAAIHLGEYRKMSPGPFEEFVFYDHPSGRSRIFAAMRWKAEHLDLFRAPSAAP